MRLPWMIIGAVMVCIPTTGHAEPDSGTTCGATVLVKQGDTFEKITHRCYGSRTYQDWLSSHNHHERRPLRAGEHLDTPPFDVLLKEQIAPRYQAESAGIAEAFSKFRSVQGEIESQLGSGVGAGAYRPTPRARAALAAAATALRPVVTRLAAAGLRSQQFAGALAQLERLSTGSGTFSIDYATEEVHQRFSYGVDRLH